MGVLANKNQGMTNTKTNISGISSVFRAILLLVVVLVVLLVIEGDRFKEYDVTVVSYYNNSRPCLPNGEQCTVAGANTSNCLFSPHLQEIIYRPLAAGSGCSY